MTRRKNPFGKARSVDNPYAVYKMAHMNFQWRIIKDIVNYGYLNSSTEEWNKIYGKGL